MAKGKFGPKLRDIRVRQGLTLRRFCDHAHVDPGNYSKIERGLFAPPGPEKIEKYLVALGIETGSDEYIDLLDLAAVDRGELPRTMLDDEALLAELPVLFRTLRGDPVDDDQLDKLIDIMRNRHPKEA